jgi:hypothetical protein
VVERATSYCGFELDRVRERLDGAFPPELADHARLAIAQAVVAGTTPHADQRRLSKAIARLDEYWRRSGGTVGSAGPDHVAALLAAQLESIDSWEGFLQTRLDLEVSDLVDAETRHRLDSLPTSIPLLGDRIPLLYVIEQGEPAVRLKLREGKARRIRPGDLPALDRPIRFTVVRGRSEVLKAQSLPELEDGLAELPAAPRRGKRRDRAGGRGGRRRR